MDHPRKRKTALARHLDALNASADRAPKETAPHTRDPVATTVPRGTRIADPRAVEPLADAAGPEDTPGSTIKIIRRSKMDPFLHLIGVKPDREVAEMAGVTSENVRAYRKRRGIPAQWREEGPPVRRRPRSATVAPTPKAEPQPAPQVVEAARGVPGARGFLVVGDGDEEFVVVADNIAQAAALAVARFAVRKPSGRVVSIQYLAEMLGG
ncbi:MAG: hypothetical protein JXB39_01360 [Deltaproteobacteria bacterium]|nr:hypothetical protein [Deltaproteobacteria bacterium]